MTDIVSTIKLSKPLKTHKGTVTDLELKEPTARLYVAHGSPFEVETKPDSDSVSIIFHDKAMMAFAVETTGIDDIILGSLPAKDWLNLRTAIARIALGVLGTDRPFADSTAPSPS